MKPTDISDTPSIGLFVIVRDDGKYFGGFDPESQSSILVDDALAAKLFTNKHDVSLRPNERLQELRIKMTKENVELSMPFRPRRRQNQRYVHQATFNRVEELAEA